MKKNLNSKKIKLCPVSAIKELNMLALAKKGSISLGQGVPSSPTPKYICTAVIKALNMEKTVGRYAPQPGMMELRNRIAGWQNKLYSKARLKNNNVLVTVGGMEGLFATCTAFLNPGDEVLLFDPSYASHIEQVILAGGTPVYIPLEFENNWAFDPALLVKRITRKTKMLILCNPSNPTGKVFTNKEIKTIVALAKKYDFLIVADETYAFLTYGKKNISLLEFPEIFDRLVVCTSFSKQFAMTGWRIGFVIASQKNIQTISKVHDAMVISAPTVSQYAALAALKKPNSTEVLQIKVQLAAQRDEMITELATVSDLFTYRIPEGAYYMFVRFNKTVLSSQNFCLKLLDEAGVVAIPGSAFGPRGEGFIRLSFAASTKDIRSAFIRIRKWNRTLK